MGRLTFDNQKWHFVLQWTLNTSTESNPTPTKKDKDRLTKIVLSVNLKQFTRTDVNDSTRKKKKKKI